MKESIKNIYFTVFLLFFRFCRKAWSYEMNVIKGVGGVTLVETWLLVGIIAWSYYATGNKSLLKIPKSTFLLCFLLLAVLNYYALTAKGRAVEFDTEFSKFGDRKRVLLIVAGIGLIVLSLVFAFASASYVHSH